MQREQAHTPDDASRRTLLKLATPAEQALPEWEDDGGSVDRIVGRNIHQAHANEQPTVHEVIQ